MDIELELDKVNQDVEKNGFGIFDQEAKRRVNPETLALMWATKKKKMLPEVQLGRNQSVIKRVYKEKFKGVNPYDLRLFRKDPAAFMERMIRAVEICTMNYVLNTGDGNLNLNKSGNLIMGKRTMIWED